MISSYFIESSLKIVAEVQGTFNQGNYNAALGLFAIIYTLAIGIVIKRSKV
ncbi:MAG: hypothetical protein HeimC3_31990 [Candidatus Heimdallarchaeota archaeon LC_3]|nr:MAG: hypothetical protein HeimC3_31990 [Candidatus Heimdallarchaeota archaeon LC_3]